MACSCNGGKSGAWQSKSPNGVVQQHGTEIEAAAAAQRTGGTYTKAP